MVYKFSQIKLIKELSEWMIHDIGASIDGGANYLTALGIASYCEILGSIYIGELGKGGSLSFNAFIDEMNPRYI